MRLIALVVITLIASIWFNTVASAASYVGKKFPEFSATDPISNKKFSLDDFRGKVVLVDFWATWCGPCVQELPNVKTVYEQYKDDGLVVISISLDSDAAKFKSFVNKRGMPWRHVMDGGGWQTRLAKKYGINSIPKMFLLDHTGVCISDSARGSSLAPAVEKALENMKNAAPAEKPKSEKTEKPASAESNSLSDQWQADLGKANEDLRAASKPLDELDQQIRSADIAEKPSSIAALRRQAFMMGLLNDEMITLPEKNVAQSEQSGLIVAAHKQLALAAADARKKFDAVSGKIVAVQSQLKDESLSADKARTTVEQTLNETGEFLKQWSPAWKSQLASLDKVLNRPGVQQDAVLKDIDAAEKTLGDIRYRMASKPDVEGARLRLNSLRSDLQAIRGKLANIPADVAVVPPESTASDVDATIKAAGNAIVQLRQYVSRQAKSVQAFRDKFAGRVKELQRDLAAAPSKDSKWTESVHQRFAALCDELLSAWDQMM